MKIRLRGNSIRLRLEQHEISDLTEKGILVESLAFPGSKTFSYCLATSNSLTCQAGFAEGELRIEVPGELAKSWGASEEVGIYQTINEGTEFEMKLAVEKDFQCLHKRPDEDESDLFPHPKA